MKTFLGFTTGLLLGILGGAFGMATIAIVSPEVSEMISNASDDFFADKG